MSGFRRVMLRPLFLYFFFFFFLGWLVVFRSLACLLLQYYRYRDRCSPKRICSFFIGYICQSCIQDQIFVASLLSQLGRIAGVWKFPNSYLSHIPVGGLVLLLLLLGSVVFEMANK